MRIDVRGWVAFAAVRIAEPSPPGRKFAPGFCATSRHDQMPRPISTASPVNQTERAQPLAAVTARDQGQRRMRRLLTPPRGTPEGDRMSRYRRVCGDQHQESPLLVLGQGPKFALEQQPAVLIT